MKKILKKNQVIITSLAVLIAVAGYLNFADVDLGFKDQAASTDGSSILEDVDYDLTDETALLDENGAAHLGKLYLRLRRILQPRPNCPGSRSVPRTRQTCRRSSTTRSLEMTRSRRQSAPWYPWRT